MPFFFLCLFRRDTSNLDVLRLNFIFVKFSVLSNFQYARKLCVSQILTLVKFSGSCKSAAKSNFHSSCSCDRLSNFKKPGSCARPSNFKKFLFLSWKKVENFFNLYYNKRGNININIFLYHNFLRISNFQRAYGKRESFDSLYFSYSIVKRASYALT